MYVLNGYKRLSGEGEILEDHLFAILSTFCYGFSLKKMTDVGANGWYSSAQVWKRCALNADMVL